MNDALGMAGNIPIVSDEHYRPALLVEILKYLDDL
jgi:hypothetical protein